MVIVTSFHIGTIGNGQVLNFGNEKIKSKDNLFRVLLEQQIRINTIGTRPTTGGIKSNTQRINIMCQ